MDNARYVLKGRRRRRFDGPPCSHFPERFKTEAAHQAKVEAQKRYDARKRGEKPIRSFESDGYPLKLKLQRILANVKFRCSHPETKPRYAGRGIQCRITYEDLLFIWERDGAENMARPSLDRENNDGHYERSNIRFRELYDNISDGVKVRIEIHNGKKSTSPEAP